VAFRQMPAIIKRMQKALTLGFITGILAVLVFHQGTAFLLNTYGNDMPGVVAIFGRTGPAFNMNPVPPLGVPTVASQAFWGGVWGIILAMILRATPVPDLLFSFVFGAVALTLVAFTLVASLKGLPTFAGGNQQIWARAALLNGAWGWGTAMLLRPLALRG